MAGATTFQATTASTPTMMNSTTTIHTSGDRIRLRMKATLGAERAE
jgi:hypothetical protein